MKILVLSGTYNESGNIAAMIDEIMALLLPENLADAELHYLVIDDNSPDGTAEVVMQKQAEYPGRLHLVQRAGKLGLGSAYRDGFRWANERGYRAVCQIDADFSHKPGYIVGMLQQLNWETSPKNYEQVDGAAKADFVIGSRYVKDGGAADWRRDRRLLSRCGAAYAQIVMDLQYKDLTGGFNVWRDYVVEDLLAQGLASDGFFFQVECKYRACRLGYRGVEFPIQFAQRREGVSKMSYKILFEALYLANRVSDFRFVKQVFRFATTGLLGSVTNLLFFFLSTDYYQILSVNIAAILAFILAGSQNYIINSLWSFRSSGSLSWGRWLKFLLFSVVGLGFNLLVLNILLLSPFPFSRLEFGKSFAQFLGILTGMVFNFYCKQILCVCPKE